MQSSNSPDRLEEQHKLLAYLDQFGKQISSRKNNSGLEQQLSSLSRAYNQAQEKLLQTERALMGESISIQKQRSVIEIYKHIIREEMQDEGILRFIQDLEQNEDKKDIYEELQSIRMLLSQKKRKEYQKRCQEERTIRELRKEVSRLHEERSCFSDESMEVNQENQELRGQLEVVRGEIELVKNQNVKLTASLEMIKQELTREKQKNQHQTIQLNHLISKQQDFKHKQQQLSAINRILSSTLNIVNNKENISSNIQTPASKFSHLDLESKLTQLQKYKTQYKKLKQNHLHTDFLKQQICLLKLFISDQALVLFKEYEQKKLECIEGELRNLAVIEKNKLIILQECEREVWKYKLMLMREDDSQQNLMSTGRINSMNNSVRSQHFSSKMQIPGNMIESLPVILEPSARLDTISQFMPGN